MEALLLEKVTCESHKEAVRMKKKLFKSTDPIPYTQEEALAYYMDNNLSKNQYINIRVGAKMRNANIIYLCRSKDAKCQHISDV